MSDGERQLSPDDPAFAGQREYTPGFLRIYDPLILGLYCRLVWRCPTPRLVAHYRDHLHPTHLDVGPGTGYFLQRARLPQDAAVTLVDPNQHVLAHAAGRLAHLRPTVVQADVCKPLPVAGRFGSVGFNLVWHCLSAGCKAAAIEHLAAVLADDGVLFGATVLGAPPLHTRLSCRALRVLNRRGTFDNLGDREESLRQALQTTFERVEIELVGAVAVFVAAGLRSSGGAFGPAAQPGRWPRARSPRACDSRRQRPDSKDQHPDGAGHGGDAQPGEVRDRAAVEAGGKRHSPHCR